MFLVSTAPTRNFVEYDRVVRKLTLSDALDRMAEQEAIALVLGRPKYRGPTADFLADYDASHPLVRSQPAALN